MTIQETFERFKTEILEWATNNLNSLVPVIRKINGYELRKDINLTYEDVGADKAGSADTVRTELTEKINEMQDDINNIKEEIDEKLTEAITVRYNSGKQMVQILKDGVWTDWLTSNHLGILEVSYPVTVLSSSSVSTGKDITGGWNPSGAFSVDPVPDDDWTNNNEDIYASTSATTNNLISLKNVTSIHFNYTFDISVSNITKAPKDSYIKVYLIDSEGTKSKTQTIKATSKSTDKITDIVTIDTSGLTGNYKIGYEIAGYHWWQRDDGADYSKSVTCYTYINTIQLYQNQ